MIPPPTEPAAPPFTAALADHLAARRAGILREWRAAVDADPELTSASTLNRREFNDHIPHVLNTFERRLREGLGGAGGDPTGKLRTSSVEHGFHRWRQGYDLREVILEWGYLQACLLRELETCRGDALPGLDPAALAAATADLAHLVNTGIADSAEQYSRLQGKESAGRLHELEGVLVSFTDAGRRRADTWREAAHDLRGQLNIIVSATALLDDDTLPGPMRDESFDLLKKGVRTLHKMLSEVLDVARLETGRETWHVAPFDAGELLGGLCAATQPLARERGLFLKIDGPESLPVEGDRGKIQRIAQNLLLNAIQNTERGEITLSWAADDAERWRFHVHDTGPGLPPAARAALVSERRPPTRTGSAAALPTAPPVRPPAPSSGEGIGLSIVRRLADLLQARVDVETAPGEGTDIRVFLPRRYREESEFLENHR